MNFVYQNALEESNIHLTDFKTTNSLGLLAEKQFYKIIWAMEDVDGIFIDGCSLKLKKDEVVFCTPLNNVQLPKERDGISAIIFNREFYCIRDNDEEVSCNGFLFYGSSFPVIIKLNEKEMGDFELIYNIFQEEFEYKDKSQGEMLRAMLKRLIIKSTRVALKKYYEVELPTEKYDLIRKFHILVEKNFKEKHHVSDYADLLYKSPKTLANVFNKYGGETPLQIINERILLESRRLLLFSNMTSEEIAYELGFNEPGHFSKFFKKNTSLSPINFKKETLMAEEGKNLQ